MGDGLRATGYGKKLEVADRELDARTVDELLTSQERESSSVQSPAPSALAESLSARERDLILEALRSDNGNRQLAAKRLGISPRTLRYKLARLREAGVQVD